MYAFGGAAGYGSANHQAGAGTTMGGGEELPSCRRGPLHAASRCPATESDCDGRPVGAFLHRNWRRLVTGSLRSTRCALARDGDPLSVEIGENDNSFTV